MRFILIDRIETLEPGRRITGYKQIDPNEDYFADHFPGFPVVPGVLALESLAQIGGRLVEATVREQSSRRVLPMLAKVDSAQFRQAIRPGDRLDLTVDADGIGSDFAAVSGVATVAGKRVCTAKIKYVMIDVNEASQQLGPAQTAALHEWSDRVWRQLRGQAS
jgi:3-hydroxyacyl-[acyl-carrier-protein] dehydratase